MGPRGSASPTHEGRDGLPPVRDFFPRRRESRLQAPGPHPLPGRLDVRFRTRHASASRAVGDATHAKADPAARSTTPHPIRRPVRHFRSHPSGDVRPSRFHSPDRSSGPYSNATPMWTVLSMLAEAAAVIWAGWQSAVLPAGRRPKRQQSGRPGDIDAHRVGDTRSSRLPVGAPSTAVSVPSDHTPSRGVADL